MEGGSRKDTRLTDKQKYGNYEWANRAFLLFFHFFWMEGGGVVV